jgi:hypothetical protein
MEPSEQQLAYARSLGIVVPEGATRSQISKMIDALTSVFDAGQHVVSDSDMSTQDDSDEKPSQQRIARAKKLGIEFDPDISKSKLNELINQVEMTLPPTKAQLQSCEALGIDLHDGARRGEVAEMIRVAESNIPYDDDLLKLEKLGVVVPPDSNRAEVERLLARCAEDPLYKEKLIEIEAQLERDELIDQYGEAIADEYLKWETIAQRCEPHMIIFKRGKKIVSQIVEIHDASIQGEKTLRIELSGYAPGDLKYMDRDDEISFEKDIELIASNVLHVQILPPHVYPLTLARYRMVIPQLEEFSKRFMTSS